MSRTTPQQSRMVADVGGTNTRIALFDADKGQFEELRTYNNRDFASLEAIIESWLEDLQAQRPETCCIAVAAPPSTNRVTMVNIDWSFSCTELARRFRFSRVSWLNDFQATAHALPHLTTEDTQLLQAGHPESGGKLATVGPGTGLGGSTLDWLDGKARTTASEPGHMGLSPGTKLELELFRLLMAEHGEIYAELLVSGPGLVRLYQAHARLRDATAEEMTPAAVTERALQGQDRCCVQALETFCGLLASVCGDFALANGAYGGLYLAGGIVPRIIPFIRESDFLLRFSAKGAMKSYLQATPVHVITTAQPGLLGAAHAPL